MKRFIFILTALLVIGAVCSACTPDALPNMINQLGVTPGNAPIVTRGNATRGNAPASAPGIVTRGNATSGNALTPTPRIVTRSNAG